MGVYYNEIDPFATVWLQKLMDAGQIPQGTIDDRSIEDIRPAELAEYTQCHFFAGIGGWAYALQLAGWPEDRHVWTGSCPCQPFSIAGKKSGVADSRHLWPAWEWHIKVNQPPTVFGEQVDSAIRYGWLDLVSNAMEQQNYAFGSAVLPACSVGAFHIRKRLWFVADACGVRWRGGGQGSNASPVQGREMPQTQTTGSGDVGVLANANNTRPQRRELLPQCTREFVTGSNRVAGHWADAQWLPCRDGKARPVESGTFPLAHGISKRVGRLRGYGNAIVPQMAAAFIQSFMETKDASQS